MNIDQNHTGIVQNDLGGDAGLEALEEALESGDGDDDDDDGTGDGLDADA